MIKRRAIRAVMLSPEGRILLMQAREPGSSFTVWFAPGGGVEADEAPHACLCREIEEETGRTVSAIGPLIWTRHHTFTWDGQLMCQDEDFYFVPMEEFEPDCSGNPSEPESRAFQSFKWWTPDEIDASSDVFAPRLLADHLRSLIESGAPHEVVDVGV